MGCMRLQSRSGALLAFYTEFCQATALARAVSSALHGMRRRRCIVYFQVTTLQEGPSRDPCHLHWCKS